MKIVLNKCYGGFSLNDKTLKRYNKLKGTSIINSGGIPRDDEILIQLVEEGGCNDIYSELTVVKIPDGCFWEISDYDGIETIYYSESEIKIKWN